MSGTRPWMRKPCQAPCRGANHWIWRHAGSRPASAIGFAQSLQKNACRRRAAMRLSPREIHRQPGPSGAVPQAGSAQFTRSCRLLFLRRKGLHRLSNAYARLNRFTRVNCEKVAHLPRVLGGLPFHSGVQRCNLSRWRGPKWWEVPIIWFY